MFQLEFFLKKIINAVNSVTYHVSISDFLNFFNFLARVKSLVWHVTLLVSR